MRDQGIRRSAYGVLHLGGLTSIDAVSKDEATELGVQKIGSLALQHCFTQHLVFLGRLAPARCTFTFGQRVAYIIGKKGFFLLLPPSST